MQFAYSPEGRRSIDDDSYLVGAIVVNVALCELCEAQSADGIYRLEALCPACQLAVVSR